MWPDRVLNPGPLTYESGVLSTVLRSPAATLSVIGLKGFILYACVSLYFDYHTSKFPSLRLPMLFEKEAIQNIVLIKIFFLLLSQKKVQTVIIIFQFFVFVFAVRSRPFPLPK